MALPFLGLAFPFTALLAAPLWNVLGPSDAWMVGECAAVFLVAFGSFVLLRRRYFRGGAAAPQEPPST